MIRAVLDSNVYISAVVFGGAPRQVVQLAEQRGILFVTATSIVDEIEGVLASKFGWSAARIRNTGARTWRTARLARAHIRIRQCVDPDDDRVLGCAVSARAGFIVTGDRHLLVLHPYKRISIVSPREFLDLAPWRLLPL